MQLVLEISGGPKVGKRYPLSEGRVICIGRGPENDIAIPEDEKMSTCHFAVRLKDGACQLKDAKSTNGTFVNGERTMKAVLALGDRIRSGTTEFVFRELAAEKPAPAPADPIPSTVVSRPAATAAPPTPALTPDPAPPAPPPRVAEAPIQGAYLVKSCQSELQQYLGPAPQSPPSALVKRLSRACPAFVVADFNKIGAPFPAELKEPEFLFTWMPEAARRDFSPVLLGAGDPVKISAILDDGWGCDGLVVLFTSMERAKVLDHFRTQVQGKPGKNKGAPQLVGCCWPSILSQMLMNQDAAAVNRLVAGIDAVFMEADDPFAWQAFSGASFNQALDEMGLKCTG